METIKRLLAALIFIPIFILALVVSNPLYFILLMTIVGAIVCYEVTGMILKKHGIAYEKTAIISTILFLLLSNLSAILSYYNQANQIFEKISSFLPLLLMIIVLLIISAFEIKQEKFERSFSLLGNHLLTIFITSTLVLFLIKIKVDYGYIEFIFLCVIVWLSDTGAYFTGKILGKHKLNLAVSPKKTIEGLIGGYLFAIAGGIGYYYLYFSYFQQEYNSISLTIVIIFSFIFSNLAVLADLTESLLKRSAGIKDTRFKIPGHGGVFDVFDTLIFTGLIYWCLLLIIK